MGVVLFFFVLIGFVCYICLGDKYTPSLVILRKAYEGKSKWSEYLFQIAIFLFFCVSIMSMPLFNPPIRDYIMVEFKFNRYKSAFYYRLWSVLPFLLASLICLAYPSIIGVFNFFSTTVFNFNGFALLLLMLFLVCVLWSELFGFFRYGSYGRYILVDCLLLSLILYYIILYYRI